MTVLSFLLNITFHDYRILGYLIFLCFAIISLIYMKLTSLYTYESSTHLILAIKPHNGALIF